MEKLLNLFPKISKPSMNMIAKNGKKLLIDALQEGYPAGDDVVFGEFRAVEK